MPIPVVPPPILIAPPRQGAARIRRYYRSRTAFSGFMQWILEVGVPFAILGVTVFLFSVQFFGLLPSYTVLLGGDAPSHDSGRKTIWLVSIIGWLFVPAVVGGFAGHVISSRIEGYTHVSNSSYKKKSIRQRLAPPPAIPWLGRYHLGNTSDREFVDLFVRQAHLNNWQTAQDHWEIAVSDLMNTKQYAEMGRGETSRSAVSGAQMMLRPDAVFNRCMICDVRR